MESNPPCRCCLLRPSDKDLKTAYLRLGQTEIYADMLKECFEIHLTLGTPGDSGICEICISRLRDACDFKVQVQHCQMQLQMQLAQFSAVKDETGTPKVKAEVIDPDDQSDNADMDFMEIKGELPEYPDDADDDLKLAELLGVRGVSVTRRGQRREQRREQRQKKRDGNDRVTKKLIKISLPLKSSDQPKIKLTCTKKYSENAKHTENLNNIIKYSNCTPFANKNIAGIICFYCRNTYSGLDELKIHNETAHKDSKVSSTVTDRSYIKMDITDLKCNICHTNVDVISSLKTHLTKEHGIKFYPDVFDYILEFKLTETDLLSCALCNSSYETFKMLLQHMNGHYRNFICDICDMGFVTKNRLNNHQKSHDIGNFKCSFCDKVFITKSRQVCHEKYTHNRSARYKTNCPNCEKSFNSYYQRNRHMIQEHNTMAGSYRCNSCDKSFIMKSKLTFHIKKVHLMERNHICPECGLGFFLKQSLEDHMVKHNGERVFKCTVCSKAYARKKTLREHMRIHNNDRRFKCGVCGLAFVQKCSLKSHMLSNHGVSLAEFENGLANLDKDHILGSSCETVNFSHS